MMNDVYFDEIEIRDLGVRMIDALEHPVAQNTRDKITTIPGTVGAYDYGADLDVIPFLLPLEVRGSDRLEVQMRARQFKSILIGDDGKPKTFKLRFGYEPDKYYNVRYSGSIPIERLVFKGQFDLPLICYDGFAQSIVKNDEITWGSTVLTFASYSYTYGHQGDGAKTFTSSGSTIVTVTGNNLRPIIHVSGTGYNVSIGWDGKAMNLGSFTNATWEIDLGEFEVTKDGQNAIDIIKGDWLDMELENGETTINVSGSGLNLDLRFEFRDRYF